MSFSYFRKKTIKLTSINGHIKTPSSLICDFIARVSMCLFRRSSPARIFEPNFLVSTQVAQPTPQLKVVRCQHRMSIKCPAIPSYVPVCSWWPEQVSHTLIFRSSTEAMLSMLVYNYQFGFLVSSSVSRSLNHKAIRFASSRH